MQSIAQEIQHKSIDISGVVYSSDQGNKEPLAGANITAYTSDSVFMNGSASNENGGFTMSVNDIPSVIKISFVGYTTYSYTDIYADNKGQINLDTCYLLPNNTFSDVIVSASGVQRSLEVESYLVTNKMRARASNTLDLLDQIHGLRYDKLSNDIKIAGKSNILFLVNDLEQSSNYILNLIPERISKVEVNKSPRGKYQSEGYDAIINIILKDEYVGYDTTVQNFAIGNLAGNNGDDWLMNEQPSVNLIYNNKKINIFTNYTYGRSKWNMGNEKDVFYEGLLDIKSGQADKHNPNDIYKYQGNAVSSGINYKIHTNHIISLQGEYLFEKMSTDNFYDNNVKDLVNNKKYKTNNLTINQTRANEYTGTLYYRGKPNQNLSLSMDFSYNHFKNDVFNALSLNDEKFINNNYIEKRNLFKFNTEAEYTFSEKVSLNLGYIYNVREYKSELSDKQNILDYKESRHRGFTHLQYNLNEKLSFEIGTGFESFSINNSETKKHYSKVLPYAVANYNISESINLKAAYLTHMQYSGLHQLNPSETAIDSLMIQVGNPDLISSVAHSFSIDLNLWNRITFTPSMIYIPNSIGEYITKDDNRFLTTFQNINTKEYSLQLVYDQPIGEYFNFTNSITYYHRKAKYAGIRNSLDGWMLDSEISYFNPDYSFMAQLGYYRNMDKTIRIQGFQMYNFDSWAITLNKQFLKNKATIMLSYFLPLEWGVRDVQKRVINSPDYNENFRINLRNYRNTFVLRINYRFNSGKVKFSGTKNTIEREERINRTFDF